MGFAKKRAYWGQKADSVQIRNANVYQKLEQEKYMQVSDKVIENIQVTTVKKDSSKENGMEKHRTLSMKAVEMELGQTKGKYEREFFSLTLESFYTMQALKELSSFFL